MPIKAAAPPARIRSVSEAAPGSSPPLMPPPRVRAPVAPPATGITTPPPRQRVAPPAPEAISWAVPEGVRPLGVGQRTHNGYTPKTGETPDPRFRPLIIVMNPDWKKRLPDYIRVRFDEAMALTVEKVEKTDVGYLASTYITEFALRQYLGYRALSEDVYDAIRERIIKNWDAEIKSNSGISMVQKSMMRIEDGDLLVDMHKSSGPFYLDTLLGLEVHYKNKLQPVAR